MLKHIVLFRFQTAYMPAGLAAQAQRVFTQLQSALPDEIKGIKVLENMVQREGNYDLGVVLDLRREASLNLYLSHPIHQQLVTEWLPYLNGRASFDYWE